MSAAQSDIDARPAARLAGLEPYSTGGQRAAGMLLLDANEGPLAPEGCLERLRSIDAEQVRRYPQACALEEVIAGKLGISAGRVVVTAGGDDAIDRVCRVSLEPGRSIVVHAPTFEMITRGARLAGGDVRSVPWMGAPFPIGDLEATISSETGLVAIVSPNNPTGSTATIDDIDRASRAARSAGALVLLDLAYIEYADEDPTPHMLALENVVMVRTFSKAFGLAGLRVGYAIASEKVAGWLRMVGGPYPVTSPGLAMAGQAIEAGIDTLHVERVRHERDRLAAHLRGYGVLVLDSQANFVLAKVKAKPFAQVGIVVRGFDGALDGWSRITLPGEPVAFERLMVALEEVCHG